MLKKILYTGALLLVMSLPARAAGFPDAFGASVRALSLGGAFTAVADDYSAVYYNPAGLARQRGNSITVEYLYTSPRIDVKTRDGQDLILRLSNGDVKVNPTEYGGGAGLDLAIPIAGLTLDINEILNLPTHVEFGLLAGFPENGRTIARVLSFMPDQPHLIRYGGNADRVQGNMGLGVEAIPELLHIGAGFDVILYGYGNGYVDGLTLGTAASNTNVVSEIKLSAQLRAHPVAGILFTPLDQKLKIGLSFREKQELALDPIPVLVAISGLEGANLGMVVELDAFFTPREYSLGASYAFDDLLVSVELNRQEWSAYRYTRAESAADSSGVVFFEGDPGFKDTLNYRLGIEKKLSPAASVMFGYSHLPSPAPDQSGRNTNYIDMDKDQFALGGAYTFTAPLLWKPLKVAGVLQYHRLKELSVDKTGVSGANGGPTWQDQESYTVKGQAYAAGVSCSMSW